MLKNISIPDVSYLPLELYGQSPDTGDEGGHGSGEGGSSGGGGDSTGGTGGMGGWGLGGLIPGLPGTGIAPPQALFCPADYPTPCVNMAQDDPYCRIEESMVSKGCCRCAPKTKNCPDGQTVPIDSSCPDKTCPDGQVVPNGSKCPDKICPDGTVVPNGADCPVVDTGGGDTGGGDTGSGDTGGGDTGGGDTGGGDTGGGDTGGGDTGGGDTGGGDTGGDTDGDVIPPPKPFPVLPALIIGGSVAALAIGYMLMRRDE